MATEVVMPQMGADMKEGTVVRWLKREGDEVQRGEAIAEIETDKATVELESFHQGTLRKILVGENVTVPVGTLIAVIGAPDEDISDIVARAGGPVTTEGCQTGTEVVQQQPQVRLGASERAEREALEGAARRTPTAEIPALPPAPAPPTVPGRIRASPIARRLAEEHGLDLSRIKGTGPDGRIVRRDVEAALAEAAAAEARAPTPMPEAPAPVAAPPVAPVGVRSRLETLTRVRQATARRMAQSKREVPHYYLTSEVDMTEAQRLRRQLNDLATGEVRISVNDMVIKAVAKALLKFPQFNAVFEDEQHIRIYEDINISIAIALADGLVAPAVLECDKKSLVQIAQASRDLAERARSGVLRPEEYTAGTFTVSNLGMYEIESVTAVIPPGQSAILGVGVVRPVPVVKEGQVVVAEMMKLSLAADHRVTDGAIGAQFLVEIRDLLQNPMSLLI